MKMHLNVLVTLKSLLFIAISFFLISTVTWAATPETVTSTPTSSVTPSMTVTATSTITLTATPSATITVTPSVTPTATMTRTCTPTSTISPTASPTPTITITKTITVTILMTATATSTITPTFTPTVSATATASPTATNTPQIVLSIVKSVDKTTAVQGEIIRYTLNYENRGGSTAMNTRISDVIPEFTVYHDSNGGFDSMFNVAYWEGVILPGRSGKLWLEVEVVSALPDTPIVNEATIICDGSNSVISNAVVTLVQAFPSEIPLKWKDDVIAYPNPGRDVVTIAWKAEPAGQAIVGLYNMKGDKVIQLEETNLLNNTVTINTHSLAPGLYLYQVTLVHGLEKKKLPVKKLAIIK